MDIAADFVVVHIQIVILIVALVMKVFVIICNPGTETGVMDTIMEFTQLVVVVILSMVI